MLSLAVLTSAENDHHRKYINPFSAKPIFGRKKVFRNFIATLVFM